MSADFWWGMAALPLAALGLALIPAAWLVFERWAKWRFDRLDARRTDDGRWYIPSSRHHAAAMVLLAPHCIRVSLGWGAAMHISWGINRVPAKVFNAKRGALGTLARDHEEQ